MSTPIPFVTSLGAGPAADWRRALGTALPGHRICAPEELDADERAAVRVAVVANPDPAALAAFPALEWVHSVWAGVERLVGTLDPQIRIVRLVDPDLAQVMSEGVLGHVLYLHRRIPEYLAQQRAETWRQLEQVAASRRCVAVLGMGHLGQHAARQLGTVGFEVLGWSRTRRTVAGVETFGGTETLPEVLARADIVTVLLPLTDATRGLLDALMLAHCKPGAALVNVARGPIVETAALLGALDRGALSHAVLDVFDTEPLPQGDPLWSHPSVTVLPHVAAPTNRDTASAIVAGNLAAYFRDGTLPEAVDGARGY